jgi:hypothetical protein
LGSLLPHAEAFKIAEDLDVPEFQVQAYVNFTLSHEVSCCNATPPPDLCETIRFIYKHFTGRHSEEHQSLRDTLLNYCVSIFKYQMLGDRQDFRQTAFENPTFQQDLCRISMSRNFEDDGAIEILNLPVCRPSSYSKSAWLKRAIEDFQYEIWKESEAPVLEGDDVESSRPTKKQKSSHGGFTLVHRPKTLEGEATCSDSETETETEFASDEDGFSLVHRPKPMEQPGPALNPSPTLNDDYAKPFTDLVPSNPFADPVLSLVMNSEPEQENKQETAGPTSDDEWDLV